VREGGQAHWIGDRAQTTVWEIALDANVAGGHSTQKPVECMARGIRNHEGDVYDPFVGSGTTLEAAEQLGRLAYAMDVAPKYVAVALERAKRLGLEPHLVSEAAPEAKEA
jgi:DNA modification methylase